MRLSRSATKGPDFPRLLGDIGGTNARFAWQASPGATPERVQVLPCASHATLADAIGAYLRQQTLATPPAAALAIATPVTGDRVAMTNHGWAFSIDALRESLRVDRLLVLNDFTALALALPDLDPRVLHSVGTGIAEPGGALGLIGPGTGLGVSGLLFDAVSGRHLPIQGEGGHASVAAATPLEHAVIAHLHALHGHVSAERVLSGPGLVALYNALRHLTAGLDAERIEPAQVLARGLAEPGSIAAQVLDMFCALLGSVAGNLALTLGARGGVYIGGGIVPRLRERFDASPFRERFEAKGRYRDYLRAIPTWVIRARVSPALVGASAALTQQGVG